ncbi:hypothetical protein MTHERMMSTA1_19880 [Methanosarcina thermophila MST-A1]|nr:hypothetical protein MTHERMMSTA1_19880 [Methanosarcina thermophila MST-A1]
MCGGCFGRFKDFDRFKWFSCGSFGGGWGCGRGFDFCNKFKFRRFKFRKSCC